MLRYCYLDYGIVLAIASYSSSGLSTSAINVSYHRWVSFGTVVYVQQSTLRTAVSRDASGILAGENFHTCISGGILESIPEGQIFTTSCSNTAAVMWAA